VLNEENVFSLVRTRTSEYVAIKMIPYFDLSQVMFDRVGHSTTVLLEIDDELPMKYSSILSLELKNDTS
jgi:hypothetical protein